MECVNGCRRVSFEIGDAPVVAARATLLLLIYDMDNLVEMRIDRVRYLIEVTPLFAEFRRVVSRLQQLAALPLDVVDDAPPIDAPMHADRDEPGLARHEARTFGHHGQCL